MTDGLDMEGRSDKSNGCPKWQVFVICSLLIAIGLAVGLGVGLSNQNSVTPESPSTTVKPPQTTTKPSATTDGVITTKPPIVATTAPLPDVGPWLDYRLPTTTVPSHYALKLHPDMETDLYTGSNAISLKISEATKYILLHVDDELNVTMTSLKLMSAADDSVLEEINIVREFRHAPFEYFVVESENELAPNTADDYYLYTLEFQGWLIGKIVGLYKTSYLVEGVEKHMVGSDMEPTDARKAYPCFDEPAMKIRYTTTLVHLPEHVALSNMDIKENFTRPDGWIETTFNPSVPMSTYLGCFCIGEFTFIETESTNRNIPLRVYIPPHRLPTGQADYALEVMKIYFDYYEDLFQMNYSLPKCDMISIPDFGTGAMENWGLITYRETNLLWDPNESSTYNKQRVAAVVAHEMVHQWFGNIVTMKWWDNIWLNEAFASFLEYLGEEVAEPTWNIWGHFLVDDLQPVMRIDSVVTSHPIVAPVESPSEITSLFDSISYQKGSSVLRMMRDILGHEHFIGGINQYLKNHAFGNADEMDLWNGVQQYLDSVGVAINITETMDPWIRQMGFPVINVDDSNIATQQHFLTDPNANLDALPSSPYGYSWNVDVNHFSQDNSTVIRQTLDIAADSMALNTAVTAGNWIKVNPEEIGYYRVNYDVSMWTLIGEQLLSNFSHFSEADRSNLIDDGFNLAAAKQLSYTQALDLTRYLEDERSFFVWDSFSSGSSYIRVMMENSEYYGDFKTYYLQKVKPTADELGWNVTGTHNEKLTRTVTLGLALRFDDTENILEATSLFSQWINDETFYIHPDVRQLVYRYGIAASGEAEWNITLDRYIKQEVAGERTNLLRGLTSTEDVSLLDRMLEYTRNPDVIKSQDVFTCLQYISYTPTGNRMSFNWVQLNWEYLVDRFSIEDRNLGRLVPNMVSDYNNELQLWEVEAFYERYPEAGAGESPRANSLNEIKTNINWMAENQDTIGNWIQKQLAMTTPSP